MPGFLLIVAALMLIQGCALGKQDPQAETAIGRVYYSPMTDRTDLPVLQYRCSRGHHGQYLPDSGEIESVYIWEDGTIAWEVSPEIRRSNTRIYQTTIPAEKVEAAIQKIAESFSKYPTENRLRWYSPTLRLGANYSPSIDVHSVQHYENYGTDHLLMTFYQENREVLQSGDNKAILKVIKGVGDAFPKGTVSADGKYTGLPPAYMFDYRGLVEYYREELPHAGLSKKGNRVYGDEELLKAVKLYVADTEHLLFAVETILALVPPTEGLTGERPSYDWDSHDFTVEMEVKDGKAKFFYVLIPPEPEPEPEPEPPATQTDIDFWYLKPGEGATPENRMTALFEAGTVLIDFGIYLPEDVAIPYGFWAIQDTLTQAGYEHTNVDEESLAQVVHASGVYHHASGIYHSPTRFSILIIPQGISLPVKEIERLPHLRYVFMGDAPEMPEGVAFVDKVGDSANLLEAIASFSDPKPLPESVGTIERYWIGMHEMNIRQGEDGKWDAHADDIFYSLVNFGWESKPIDCWFPLQELKRGRDGLKDDRAFFMDRETGKIGEAAVRKNHETGKLEVRIKMEREESLIVRIVRERTRHGQGPPTGIGFMEFESLPEWKYEK